MRKQRLNEAVDFYQFFADADDVDHWMVDTLRLVSSDDVGRDEANAQSLLKKHKVCIRYMMTVHTEFTLATWPKMVKFAESNITEFQFLFFSYISYH